MAMALADWKESCIDSPSKRHKTIEQDGDATPDLNLQKDNAQTPKKQNRGSEPSDDAASSGCTNKSARRDLDDARPYRKAWSNSFDDAQTPSSEEPTHPLHQQSPARSEDSYAWIPSQESAKSCDDAALMQSLVESLRENCVSF